MNARQVEAEVLRALPREVIADTVGESWLPVDLRKTHEDGYAPPHPEILETVDGTAGFFYRGKVNGLHGDSGIGKSWVALWAAAQELNAGRNVLILDYESTAAEVLHRLGDNLQVHPEAIFQHLTYIQPDDPTGTLEIPHVVGLTNEDTSLVVIDSVGEAFGLDGIDENSDADVGPWLRRVARSIAEAGPAVILIDHSTKAADNPLHPSGSKRKRAAITGASYLVTARQTFTKDNPGTLTLTCAKDRHGFHARNAVVANVEVTPMAGKLVIAVTAARKNEDTQAEILHAIATQMVKIVRDHGGAEGLTGNSLEQFYEGKAGSPKKRAAIDLAVKAGALKIENGPRGAKHHHFVAEMPVRNSGGPS